MISGSRLQLALDLVIGSMPGGVSAACGLRRISCSLAAAIEGWYDGTSLRLQLSQESFT